MRRSLAIRSLLVSALTVIVFVVPLAVLVKILAAERALTLGRSDARALAPVLSIAGDPRVTGAIVNVAQRAAPRQVTVVFPDGSVLGAGEVVDVDPIADPVALRRAREGQSFEQPTSSGTIVYEPVLRSNATIAVIRVEVPRSQLIRGVYRNWAILGAIGAVLIGLSVFVSDRLGRSVVRDVDRLADTAFRLGRGDVSVRADPSGPKEIREVGVALNQLADRIDELLGMERAAVADLSHRLRTPVAALRLEMLALDDQESNERVEFALEELTRTVDQIIKDAAHPVQRGIGVSADLARVVADRFAFWKVLADEQHREASCVVPDDPVYVAIVSSELASVVDVMLDNVFSHTLESVGFAVEVKGANELAVLTVSDSGAGFPSGFGFVRGGSGSGSTGLGLDIARRVAESVGGSLEIRVKPSGGAIVTFTVPTLSG